MSELEPDCVRPLLRGVFGDPYLYLAEIGSTQDVLRDADHPHGAVAVAEHQTAGRGRSGRRWDDAASTALLFSVLLRPPAAAPLPQLSLVAGLAVAEALERETGAGTRVKWPNDVLINSAKVAGVLLEAAGSVVVCGIGVNINQTEGELPAVTRTPATSLRIVCGRELNRGGILASILVALEGRYGDWLVGGLESLQRHIEERNVLRGRRVRVGGRAGVAGPIAPDGRLSITLDRGDVVLVESGEVELSADA